MKPLILICLAFSIIACGEDWSCKVDGKTMYSVSSTGKIESADKGCSCEEIRTFELRTFGEVDEEALKSDFGC